MANVACAAGVVGTPAGADRHIAGGDGWSITPDRHSVQARLRYEWRIERLHRLGPRPVAEFVLEIVEALAGSDIERRALIEARLDAYCRLNPEVLAELGGDRCASVPLTVIGGTSP